MSTNEYMRVYMNTRYAARRAWAEKQLGNVCTICGSDKGLEFDHIDPNTKNKNISDMLVGSIKSLIIELEKCQLLCVDCHIEKTLSNLGRSNAKNTHGTLSSYRYCRCIECVTTKSKHNKEYKQKIKLASIT